MSSRLPFPFRAFLALWLVTTVSLIAFRWEQRPLPYRFRVIDAHEVGPHTEWHLGLFQPEAGGSVYSVQSTSQYLFDEGRWHTYVQIVDTSGRVVAVKPSDLHITNIFSQDVDGDGNAELVACYQQRTASGMSCWSWPDFHELWRHEIRQPEEFRGVKVWDAAIRPASLIPTADGSGPIMLCESHAGYGLQPRGLVAIAGKTGETRWQHGTAATPELTDTLDLDRDGSPEILIGSYGPANGARFAGCSDDSCFLAVLDMSGNLRWRRSWPPPFPGVTPRFSANARGEPEILALRSSGSVSGPPNLLLRIDPLTGVTRDSTVFTGHGGGVGLFRRQFQAGRTNGFLVDHAKDSAYWHAADGSRIRPVENIAYVRGEFDLSGDGILELVTRTPQARTEVRDTAFNVLAEYPANIGEFFVQDVNPTRAVIWLAEDEAVRLVRYERNPGHASWWLRRILWGLAWITVGLVTALIVTLVGFQYRRIQEQRREDDEKARRITELMAVVRHIRHQQGAPLQLFGDQLYELEYATKQGTADLLSAIAGTRADYERLKRRLDEVIRSIRKYVNAELLDRRPFDLAEFIRHEFKRANGRHRIAEVALQLESGPQQIHADPEQLRVMLDMLIDNASKAMPERSDRRPEIEIKLYSSVERSHATGEMNWIHLDLADNGAGFPPEVREEAFRLGFTTRKEQGGTGFGLAFVHKTVTDHGGDAWIESESGHGTTMHLRFPRA